MEFKEIAAGKDINKTLFSSDDGQFFIISFCCAFALLTFDSCVCKKGVFISILSKQERVTFVIFV